MKPYVVVMRTPASAIFYPGVQFSMTYSPEGRESFSLTFRTSYDEKGKFDAPQPMDFVAEARGPAGNVKQAVEWFANAAREMSSIIALSVNASMGTLHPELVFDEVPGASEHEFFQSFIDDSPRPLVPGRSVDVEVVGALVQALAKHPERKRLQLAIGQYEEALLAWRPGSEISCLAHLYMGVEAVTPAVFKNYTTESKAEVAAKWGIKEKQRIDSEIRKRLVFQGDEKTFTAARKVSDGVEHGFLGFHEMRKPASEAILKTAAYLRKAIFETIGVEERLRSRALGREYERPRGPLVLVRYIYGSLVGPADQILTTGPSYPSLTWQPELKNVFLNERGMYSFALEPPTIGAKGAQFKVGKFEIWDSSTIGEPPSDDEPTSDDASGR